MEYDESIIIINQSINELTKHLKVRSKEVHFVYQKRTKWRERMREPAIASGRISLASIKSSPVLVSGTTPISQVWLHFNIWAQFKMLAKFHNLG